MGVYVGRYDVYELLTKQECVCLSLCTSLRLEREREREREVGPPTQQSFERDVVVVAAVGYVRR